MIVKQIHSLSLQSQIKLKFRLQICKIYEKLYRKTIKSNSNLLESDLNTRKSLEVSETEKMLTSIDLMTKLNKTFVCNYLYI